MVRTVTVLGSAVALAIVLLAVSSVALLEAAYALDVTIVKTDSPDPVVAGQTLFYTISVSNAGAGTASPVSVTDTFPAQLTNVT